MTPVVDAPAEVAAVVAQESAWVPGWQRLVLEVAVLIAPGLVLLGVLPPPGAAVMAVALCLASRLAPLGAARRLHRAYDRATVRRLRHSLLAVYAGSGTLTAASVPRAMPEVWSAAASVIAVLVIVLQHRPAASSARVGVGAEVVESAAVMALLPTLVVATARWWQ